MSLDSTHTPPVPLDSFTSLGSLLRQTREARGLSVAEAAHDTFIRSQYVEALEGGDLARLPEPVYIVGFLKRYAEYLGLDAEALARQAQPFLEQTVIISQIPKQNRRSLTVPLRPMHLWGAYVVLIVLAVGGLSSLLEGSPNPLSRWMQAFSNLTGPAGQTSSKNLDPKVFPTLEQWIHIAGVFPRPRTVTKVVAGKPVQLDIRVVESPSWLRVVADGRTVFEATLQPGAELNWSANERIILRTGNAGGVLVTFNNQELGALGKLGEVTEKVFQRRSGN